MTRAWVGLALVVATAGCDLGRSDDAPPPPATAGEAPPEVVAVDWLGRGTLFAGRVVGRREGLIGVVYADGDREWVEAERVRPWPSLAERRIQVWMLGGAQNVTVIEERGSLVHVRFDDGTHTWASREMIYALEGAPTVAADPTPARTFPIRPATSAPLRAGSRALVYWVNDAGVQRAAPWLAEVTGVDGEQLEVRYLSDGSTGSVSRAEVLRVFDDAPPARVGERAFVAASVPVGRVSGAREGSFLVRIGEEESWIESGDVLGAAPAVDPARLIPGTPVTALWNGAALYHGSVVSREGDQVTLAWHDGSTPTPVPIADVVEVWEPTDATFTVGGVARRPAGPTRAQ